MKKERKIGITRIGRKREERKRLIKEKVDSRMKPENPRFTFLVLFSQNKFSF